MRVTSDLWHRIDQAARAAGQSFSAEVENRLNASFTVDDALTGPARHVIKHLIGAFGAETDVNNPAEYIAAMSRVIEALASRYPGLFTTYQVSDATLSTMDIAAANELRAMRAQMEAREE
jgi:hypothetical protein